MLIFKKVKNKIEIVFAESTIRDLKKVEESLSDCDWLHKIQDEQLYSVDIRFGFDLSDWDSMGIIDKLIPVEGEEEGGCCVVLVNGIKHYVCELSEQEYN